MRCNVDSIATLLQDTVIPRYKTKPDFGLLLVYTSKNIVESNELSSGSWPKQLALSANTKRSQKSTSS